MNADIINNGIKYLSKDKNLLSLIEEFDTPIFNENFYYFIDLSKTIIYQQLSGKVAKIIYTRYINLFKNKTPDPKFMLQINYNDLRYIGLSKQKINYLINLSNYFIFNKNNVDFINYSDEKIKKDLIRIKGIGPWTIDMFLMFTLNRMDILPVGDLGIKKGFQILFNLETLPSNTIMIEKASIWKPYRTIACCYLWKLVDDGDVW